MKRALVRLRRRLLDLHSAKLLVAGYAAYMTIGWLLLCLPFSQSAPVSALDNLFTAVSAVSTTGLVTIDPGSHYSWFGQLVVVALIQAGGLGYMTLISFVILTAVNPRSRLSLKVSRSAFALPHGYEVRDFLRRIVIYALAVEALGALILYFLFLGRGVEAPAWSAVFHSVSAFCTAGFSLHANSFESFVGDTSVSLTLAALSYAGGIGFLVVDDGWRVLTRKSPRLGFTSRVILRLTGILAVAGTLLLLLVTVWPADMPPWERVLAAFFQAMTAQTTVGFNTLPIGTLALPAIMVIYLLMIFGASPAGTGGGLKITTLAVLIGIVRSVSRERQTVTFMRRTIPEQVRTTAIAACALYVLILGSALFLLSLTETIGFEQLLFEALSALGTVGLSMGATGSLSELGKIIVIFLMFVGRVGFVTLGIAAAGRDESGTGDSDEVFVV